MVVVAALILAVAGGALDRLTALEATVAVVTSLQPAEVEVEVVLAVTEAPA